MSIFGVLFHPLTPMAESKKKTTTKKSSTGAKKTTTSASKKTKKTATKKTVAAPVVSTPAVKKVAPKKVVKATKKPAHFTKDLIPETVKVSKPARMDTSIFTTVLALFVVALVVLGGYIYSRQSRMMEPPAPPLVPAVTEPQRISISSSVTLTPDIIAALETLVTQIAIGPDEVLQNVRSIADTQAETVFASDVQSGDFVFEFKSASILYRPSTKQVIKTAPPATV
jgi:preprotein translocase subunit SecE